MRKISVRELHQDTGGWLRKAARTGSITVTHRGKPIARITPIDEGTRPNPFRERVLRPGFARLAGKLTGGTDSTRIVSEDRDGR